MKRIKGIKKPHWNGIMSEIAAGPDMGPFRASSECTPIPIPADSFRNESHSHSGMEIGMEMPFLLPFRQFKFLHYLTLISPFSRNLSRRTAPEELSENWEVV